MDIAVAVDIDVSCKTSMYFGEEHFEEIQIVKIIILPVVLYGCETSSVTLREEHRLRVFENKVLRTKEG
jgi:hypothetical protein